MEKIRIAEKEQRLCFEARRKRQSLRDSGTFRIGIYVNIYVTPADIAAIYSAYNFR
jgi:hypothetical protein